MSWAIYNDGRIECLDDGPRWPWFIGPIDEDMERLICADKRSALANEGTALGDCEEEPLLNEDPDSSTGRVTGDAVLLHEPRLAGDDLARLPVSARDARTKDAC